MECFIEKRLDGAFFYICFNNWLIGLQRMLQNWAQLHISIKKRRFKVGRWGPRWHKNISSNMCSIFFFFTNLCHFCNCTLKLRALESVWQTDAGQHWKEIELTKGQRLLLKSISQAAQPAKGLMNDQFIRERERERWLETTWKWREVFLTTRVVAEMKDLEFIILLEITFTALRGAAGGPQ